MQTYFKLVGYINSILDLFRNSPNRKFLFADVWDFEVAHHGYERSLLTFFIASYWRWYMRSLISLMNEP